MNFERLELFVKNMRGITYGWWNDTDMSCEKIASYIYTKEYHTEPSTDIIMHQNDYGTKFYSIGEHEMIDAETFICKFFDIEQSDITEIFVPWDNTMSQEELADSVSKLIERKRANILRVELERASKLLKVKSVEEIVRFIEDIHDSITVDLSYRSELGDWVASIKVGDKIYSACGEYIVDALGDSLNDYVTNN